jgi:L-serine/L-threonine ammonia-lyase
MDAGVSRAYIHPFEGEALIRGHSSLVAEIQDQLKTAGMSTPPDAVVCSVGGGGLLAGILNGMDENGWPDGERKFQALLLQSIANEQSKRSVPVIACETTGASSLHHSLKSTYSQSTPSATQATLPGITSIATSLGARTPSLKAVDACLRHPGGVVSLLADDKRAVNAVVEFASEFEEA